MKLSRPILLLTVCVTIVAAALFAINSHRWSAGTPTPEQDNSTISGNGISADGITLRSTSVDLPIDAETYPKATNSDIMDANCTACHSPSMAIYQPELSGEKWQEEIDKMRNTFGAVVDKANDAKIVAYLTAYQASRPPTREALQ